MPLIGTFNFIAMLVGYITIVVIILFILVFMGLIVKEKIENRKWKKDQEKRQKEIESKKKEDANGKELQKEVPKEAVPEGVKVESTIK